MAKNENRIDVLADFDIDGAVFQIGIQHYALGPPGPVILVDSGPIALTVRAHITDIDTMLAALVEGRKKLLKIERARAKAAR
jgi:hypothetical protein